MLNLAQPSRNQKLLLLAIFIALAVAVAGAVYFFGGGLKSKEMQLVTTLRMDYPEGWLLKEPTEAERNAGVYTKLNHKDPEASAIVRTIIGDLDKSFQVDDNAMNSIDRGLSEAIAGYKLVNKGVSQIRSHKAVQIRYTEQAEGEKEVYEVLLVAVFTPKQEYNLVFRTLTANFTALEAEFAETLDNFGDFLDSEHDKDPAHDPNDATHYKDQ